METEWAGDDEYDEGYDDDADDDYEVGVDESDY